MSTHTFFSLCVPSPVATVKVPLSQPCFDHFFGLCFRGHDEAGLLAFSMSLFSDVGPLEAIAENKTEQKSAAKCRQRLLKARPKCRQATMRVFPQRGAFSRVLNRLARNTKLCSRHSAVGLVGLFVCTIILEIQFFA